ncbi:hypothetical protein [Streptacidiphilus rugosus]|uniref:hypothetical protein n=1 Tax=Streptacidiphilus rugosus TaxID=405783 RepID=UPI00068F34B9|nr:hypothetical protein [Streptacidiphilus rugosus]
MIVKPISTRSYAHNTVAYLFGPGRSNEHTDPHLVAAWIDRAPDPGRHPDQHTVGQLAARLDIPIKALRPDQRPKVKYLHIPIRTAPGDRQLTDAEWASVARRVLTAGGLLVDGDTKGPRWIAVRHADDHIHLLVGLVRQDGRAPEQPKYWIKEMRREVDRIEQDLGLQLVRRGDGTAAKRPGHKEHFKATRQNRPAASVRLRTAVREALTASASVDELVAHLAVQGVLANVARKPSGDIRGITFAHQPEPGREPVWFSGSRLAPDLSLPKILTRLAAAEHFVGGYQPGDPWRHAARHLDHYPRTLDHATDQEAADHIHALGALLDATTHTAPAAVHNELRAATVVFERATRSRKEADYQAGRATRELAYQLTHTHGTGDAVTWLLCVLIDAVFAAARWHQAHRHEQQEHAARQTLIHLRAAYQQTAAQPLAHLTRQAPDPRVNARWQTWIHAHAPGLAERITTDPHWPALATALHHADASGSGSVALGDDDRKDLGQADNPAALLLWRIHDQQAQQHHRRAHSALTRSRLTTRPSTPASSARTPGITPDRNRHR